MNAWSQELERYLTIRRSLGYALRTDERILRRFIAFADQEGATHLSTTLFLRWQAVCAARALEFSENGFIVSCSWLGSGGMSQDVTTR